jgi:hypothetical protein
MNELECSNGEHVGLLIDEHSLIMYDILRDNGNDNDNDNDNEGLNIFEILQEAQKYYDNSKIDSVPTPTQYYIKLSSMIKAGIIRKNKKSKYELTTYGILIGMRIRDPIRNLNNLRWSLAMVDVTKDALTKDEHILFIKQAIKDSELQNIVLKMIHGNTQTEKGGV